MRLGLLGGLAEKGRIIAFGSRQAPDRTARRRTVPDVGTALVGAVLVVVCVAAGARPPPRKAPPATPTDASRTEAELRSVKAEIERIAREVGAEQVERDRIARELRSAEGAVGKARTGLEELRRARAERAQKRAELAAERRAREDDIARGRAELATELRAAYVMGREEPLKLLLSQQDPARASRMLAWYGYFGQARARHIGRIEEDLGALARIDAALQAEDAQLQQLEAQRSARLAELEQARAKRSQVLASIEAQTQTKTENLARLRAQQAGLEKLLRELRAAMARAPMEGGTAFGQLRGRLAWPADGRVVARFGQERAGALKWDGLLLATERGAPVRAVATGRVIYADWLPGLGLLAIVDHGEGYMSLYGHNERLYKGVGDRVTAGDALAASGDTGGSSRPELYFEIRKGGKPLDPRPWFRSAEP